MRPTKWLPVVFVCFVSIIINYYYTLAQTPVKLIEEPVRTVCLKRGRRDHFATMPNIHINQNQSVEMHPERGQLRQHTHEHPQKRVGPDCPSCLGERE